MEFDRLEKNITDVIKEQQLKLGYRSEVVRLYYPLLSLNRLLGTDLDIEGMKDALARFVEEVQDKLGKIDITNNGDRYCFRFPEKTSEYIQSILSDDEFIAVLINKVGAQGCTIEDIIGLFKRYSENVHIEKVDNGEFDYLLYFQDGFPDEYRYCLTDEGCHVTYHRYTEDDYKDFGF